MKDWIAIFKTGTHTDSNGNTKDWTEKELDNIAEKYNPKEHEAPVVIGHPKDNAPAYGWIESVKREGNVIYAKLKDLVPEFVDMVKKGMFKKRSISLYPDGTLRHVGWLGATPPAVKGLPDFAFKDQKDSVTIELMEEMHLSTIRQVFQRIRDWVIEKEGGEQADKIINQWDLESLRNTEADDNAAAPAFSGRNEGKEEKAMKFFDWLKGLAAKEGVTIEDLPTAPAFSEADVQAKIDAAVLAKETEFSEKIASLDEQRKKKDVEFKAREDALKEKETEGKKKAVASFCEDLKKKGVLIPAMEKLGMGITEFMQQIALIETTIEFGEEGKKEKQTPLEFMQAFLSALPKAIEFGEVAGRDKDAGSGNAAEKIEALVKEKMKANTKLTYGIAFAEVQKENSELAAEYAEELKG